jgi:ABC-2 type transport system permease protein
MIGAILRAQWLSMRWGKRQGAGLSAVLALVWYGFWCIIALGASELARTATPALLEIGVPTALLLVLFYWQVVPVFSASMGAGLDMRKLLVYPAPHDRLFLVEVLLRLTTGGEMLLVLAGGAAGLLRNQSLRGVAGAPQILPAILIYIAFNALLASGLRSLLERLLSRRRVREVVVLLVVFLGAAPRLLLVLQVDPRSFGMFRPLANTAFLPWSAAARVILGHSQFLFLSVAALWTIAAGWFGRVQFERNLRYDAMAAQATPAGKAGKDLWTERLYRLPSRVLRDPLATLLEKELRSLVRTPRFRMVFIMGFTFGVVFWLPIMIGGRADRNGWMAHNFLAVVSVYALTLLGQVTYWNCFGFDRSAAQIYFSSPQPIRLTLAAKNIASLVFVYLEVLIIIGVTLMLRLAEGPGKVLETFLVVGVSSLYLMAFGNISSVRYPHGMKPERVSRGGSSNRFQGLIFVLYPLALLPVALAYLARYALDSDWAFAIMLAFSAALGGFLYWLGLDSAVRTAQSDRERILHDLSSGDGPVAAD